MKRLLLSLFALLCSFFLFACEETANDPGDSDGGYKAVPAFNMHFTLPDQYNFLTNFPNAVPADEGTILFSDYTSSTVTFNHSSVTGYSLDQFIPMAAVNAATPDPDNELGTNDARSLYSTVVVSNRDGFDIRTKFAGDKASYNADVRWDMFSTGYLLDLVNDGRVYYPSIGKVNFYSVGAAYDVYLFRKIDVKRPDSAGSLATFETGADTDSYVDDTDYTELTGLETTKFNVTTINITIDGTLHENVKAISLEQFITTYVTDVPANYTYNILALDPANNQTGWTYENIQQGYFLPDLEIICRVDPSNAMISGTRIYFPKEIDVISTSTVEYSYTACPPPAYAAYKAE